MGTLVDYATDKGVALLTLTDPPVNALTHEMFKELDASILEARFDDDVHVLVITGHGDKYYFCLHANETLLRLENTPKLVIAAINGHCLGGGFELTLACDLRIARGGAYQLGLPEVGMGTIPATGGTQRLVRVAGKSRAIELMVEAQTVSVLDALALGLVNKAWETETHEAFVQRVLDYAHQFCPPGYAATAVGLVKRAAQAAEDATLEQGIALERELQQRLVSTADAKEGLAAYAQKRKAVFRAR